MGTGEEIALVKDIVLSLLKAKKAVRMYPDNNPVKYKTVEDAHAKLTRFLESHHELALDIRPAEILMNSERVYHNPEKAESLAFYFFKDGVVQLRFQKGLSAAEIEDFVKIISIDFDREALDDDVVTLMWEKDFQNIKYVTDESFLMEDDNYEEKATAQVVAKSPSVDTFYEAYAEATRTEKLGDIPIIPLTDRDLQSLVQEIESDSEEDKMEKLSKMLFIMLDHASDVAESEDVISFFKHLLLFSLAQGDLLRCISIVKRAKEAAENPRNPDHERVTMKALAGLICTDEIMKVAGEMFDSHKDINETALNDFTALLSSDAIQSLITLLGELNSIHGRKKVISLLINLGRSDIKTLARSLNDPRWYVVRNIIHILRHIADKEAEAYLLTSARHSDARVRREVIKAFGELRSTSSLSIVKECLDDADPLARQLAAKALGDIGTDGAKRILLEKIADKNFGDRDFDERREFYGVLARWPDPELVESMLRTLIKKSLFKRARDDEEKACAAYCLGLMGNREALPALRSLQDSKNQIVREQASAAIRRIESGQK